MNANTSDLSSLPTTREAVIWAYRMLLGREPESDEIVELQQRLNSDLLSLRRGFLDSQEFKNILPGLAGSDLGGNEPSNRVDCEGTPEQLLRLFDHIQQNWQSMGKLDPYYSVVTASENLGAPPKEVIQKFFQTGSGDVERFLSALDRNGLSLSPRATCLEFGCGIGRVTRVLAPYFKKVFAVDISAAHLRLAEKHACEDGVEGVEWMQLDSVEALNALPNVDVIFSLIVLQHNPPPVIERIVRTFSRMLNSGGIAYFQVPTYRLDYTFDLQGYLDSVVGREGMEMHVYPQRRVFRHFMDAGAVPIEVIEDGSTGRRRGERSNTFLFRKPTTGT